MPEAHAPTERILTDQTIQVPGALVNAEELVSDKQELMSGMEYRIPLNPDSPSLKQYRDRLNLSQPPLEMFLRLSIHPQEPGMQIVMKFPWGSPLAVSFEDLGVDPTPPFFVKITHNPEALQNAPQFNESEWENSPTPPEDTSSQFPFVPEKQLITLSIRSHSARSNLTPLQDFLKEAALPH